MSTWHVNRLSVEWVGPIPVAVNGAPVTGWTYAIVSALEQLDDIADIAGTPTSLEDGLGILVGPGTDHPLEPGEYTIWIRYVDDPEAVVLEDVGRVVITRGGTP